MPIPPPIQDPAQDATDVRAQAAACGTLTELNERIVNCFACPRLVEWREEVAATKRASFREWDYWGRPGPSFGPDDAPALIVGLAPAAHGTNRTGRMFTGDRSGDWLYAALHRAGFANQPTSVSMDDGLALTGVRITAAAHCAPPANKPTPEEFATCAGWLDREFTLMEPRLRAVMCLGALAWNQTLAAMKRLDWSVPSPKPKFTHGAEATVFSPTREVRLIASYHVSQQNTFTGKLTEEMLDDVISRLRA